jgi:hypothetical protein
MKCPHCGYENEEGALFCEHCKGDLSNEPVAVPVAGPAEVPVAQIVGAPGHSAAAPVAAVATPVEAVSAIPVAAAPVAEAAPAGTPVAAPVAAQVVAAPVAAPVAEPTPQATPAAAPAAPVAAPVAEPTPQATPAAPVPTTAAPAAPEAQALPPGAQPKLVVLRGLKIGMEYPIYEGLNFIGRADEKPVDIDLEDQEPPDRIWCSRQHAVINFENNCLTIEDLNSSNGTYVNRSRVYPGQKRPLNVGDVIQIGSVQLKVKV